MAATKIEKATMAHLVARLEALGGWEISERTPGKHVVARRGAHVIDLFLMGETLFAEKLLIEDVTDSSDAALAWAEQVS